MRKGSLASEYDMFVHAALVAAQSSADRAGFRQKDVRFFIELFSNWMNAAFAGTCLEIHNNQIKRYLDDLVLEGMAKKISKQRSPSYLLTQTGLLEILSKLMQQTHVRRMEHFLFLFHFMETYHDHLQFLVKSNKDMALGSLLIDMDYLLNPRKLLQEQLALLEREIRKLENRIAKAKESGAFASKLRQEGKTLGDIIQTVQKHYPYGLNHQRSLSDLYAHLPEDLKRRELEQVPRNRALRLWTPELEMYKAYHKILSDLL